MLTATENGYGKRTPIVEYTRHGRGTKGMIAIQQTERNGTVVAAALVRPDDEVMLISTGGVLIRTQGEIDPRDEPLDAGRHADQPRRRREARRASSASSRPRRMTSETAGRSAASSQASAATSADDHDRLMASERPRTTTATARSCRIAPRSTRSTAEILERAERARGARAGDRRARRPRRRVPARARGAGARAAAGSETADRCPNEAVAGVFRQVMSACLALEQTLRDRLPRSRRHVLATPRSRGISGSSSTAVPCATIDDVFRAAESGRPTTRSCPSRIRPRARSAARSISCARRRSRSAARSSCGSSRTCCPTAHARSATIDEGLLARAVARAVRAVARAASARGARASPWRATPKRRASPLRSRAPPAIAGENAAAIYGSTSLAPHIEDEPNNTTRFWVLGRQRRAAVRQRRDLARDVGAQSSGRRAQRCSSPSRRTVSACRGFESRPARTGLWEYLFFVDLDRPRRPTRAVAAALAELRRKRPCSSC